MKNEQRQYFFSRKDIGGIPEDVFMEHLKQENQNMKSGEDGLIGPGSNNYGRDEKVVTPTATVTTDFLMSKSANFPRRNCQWLKFPAETALQKSTELVEGLGADIRLTEAIQHIAKAQELVADFIDADLYHK